MQFAVDYLRELKQTLEGLDVSLIGRAIDWIKEARDTDHIIYTCGNGGSAAIASHFLVDLLKGGSYGHDRRFKMICLNDSMATVTAYANDIAYECVFVEQLRNFARPGDLLIALSGSGNSPNVLRAVEYANTAGCRTIGLTKAGGGKLVDLATRPRRSERSHGPARGRLYHPYAHHHLRLYGKRRRRRKGRYDFRELKGRAGCFPE